MVEQLSTVDKSKYQIEFFWRLEGKFKRHNEGVVDLSEDRSLSQGVGHL